MEDKKENITENTKKEVEIETVSVDGNQTEEKNADTDKDIKIIEELKEPIPNKMEWEELDYPKPHLVPSKNGRKYIYKKLNDFIKENNKNLKSFFFVIGFL